MDRIARHLAMGTVESLAADVIDGTMEGFNYWDRNGKHRAVEAFNPMTGVTTTFSAGGLS